MDERSPLLVGVKGRALLNVDSGTYFGAGMAGTTALPLQHEARLLC